MSGNVWKWMDDCWEGNCTKRVIRGGAWSGKPRGVRAAFRISIDTSIRGSASGFRLARTIPVSSSPQPLKDATAVTDTTNEAHTTSTKSDIQSTNAAISKKLRELLAKGVGFLASDPCQPALSIALGGLLYWCDFFRNKKDRKPIWVAVFDYFVNTFRQRLDIATSAF